LCRYAEELEEVRYNLDQYAAAYDDSQQQLGSAAQEVDALRREVEGLRLALAEAKPESGGGEGGAGGGGVGGAASSSGGGDAGGAHAVGLYKLKCSRPITRKRLVTTLGSYTM
jgi:hypothetical protein